MEKNQNPGMNKSQMETDREGYKTTVEYVTGGMHGDWGSGGGPEVGNQYDLDPMGEEYSDVTYTVGSAEMKGGVGKPGSSKTGGGQHD